MVDFHKWWILSVEVVPAFQNQWFIFGEIRGRGQRFSICQSPFWCPHITAVICQLSLSCNACKLPSNLRFRALKMSRLSELNYSVMDVYVYMPYIRIGIHTHIYIYLYIYKFLRIYMCIYTYIRIRIRIQYLWETLWNFYKQNSPTNETLWYSTEFPSLFSAELTAAERSKVWPPILHFFGCPTFSACFIFRSARKCSWHQQSKRWPLHWPSKGSREIIFRPYNHY